MLDELDMMNGMVELILSFTRDDSKQEARSLLDLSALVEGICEDAVDAGEKVTFSGPRDVTISCRPTAMRRAISNLVDNAVKYGGKADVTLAPEAGRTVITVEDEGSGIPRNEREKVFEPFYRIGSARDPSTGGVGLGSFRHSLDRLGTRWGYHPRQSQGRGLERAGGVAHRAPSSPRGSLPGKPQRVEPARLL